MMCKRRRRCRAKRKRKQQHGGVLDQLIIYGLTGAAAGKFNQVRKRPDAQGYTGKKKLMNWGLSKVGKKIGRTIGNKVVSFL